MPSRNGVRKIPTLNFAKNAKFRMCHPASDKNRHSVTQLRTCLRLGRRRWFDGVGHLGFEGDVDAGSWLEGYYVAAGIGERVFDADFAKQIISRDDGDLRLFGLAVHSSLYNFVHDCGNGLPRAGARPNEFGMILKTAPLFAADEFAEFTELAGKLVVVLFLLDLGAEHVHTFTFFGSHRWSPTMRSEVGRTNCENGN